MAGVCVTVLAIMGMILCGYALSVQESERITTGYEYVTDISGLFDYSQDPQYVPYNPSANWTGFYTSDSDVTDGINYTTSSAANNYPIRQQTTIIDTGTLDLTSVTTTNPFATSSSQYYWFFASDLEHPEPSDNTTDLDMFMMETPSPGGNPINNSNTVALLSALIENNMSISQDANVIVIKLDNMVAAPISAWESYTYVVGNSALRVQAYNVPYSEYSQYTSLMVDLESNVVSFLTSSGGIGLTSSANEVTIAYRMVGAGAYSGQSLGTTVTIVQRQEPTPIYMSTNEGVTLSSSSVSWSNGYPVGAIDILFRVPNVGTAYTNTLTIPLTNGPDGSGVGTINAYVAVATSGRVLVTLSSGGVEQTIDMGQWRNFMLSLDFVDGEYSIVPVTQFATFNDFTALEDSRAFDRITVSGTAGTITWGYSGASLTLGVVGTAVFMETYGVVMTDPTLTISEWFPELADLQLNFYSFALYGESITINGEVYPLDDGARINVPYMADGVLVDSWHTLTNIYITFEDRVYLTFVNDGYTADLGEMTTDTIEFSGNWYFTSGLYEGYETTETYFEWTFEDFIFDSDAAIIVFLGLLAVGTAVVAKFVGIRGLDIIVVVCAGVFGYVMLGVFP